MRHAFELAWRASKSALPLLVLVLAVRVAHAQRDTVFRANTSLVVLHVTVKDHRDELVTNLDRNAFTVYENGKPQPIALFRRDDIPVSLGLLIDNSGSMRALRGSVEAAALACVQASNPDDEVFVLNFADKPRIDVPLTGEMGVLRAGIARGDSIGGTPLRDAIDTGSRYLTEHAGRDRKVLLVITDGDDNASLTSLDQIREDAAHREIAIYAIGLESRDNPGRMRRGRDELERLAALTGGAAYFSTRLDELDRITVAIAHQIRRQYTIAYSPLDQSLDGSYRKLRIAMRPPGLVATTRAGYRAVPKD